MKFLRESKGTVLIDLRIVPNAKKTEIVGAYGETLKMRVSAPPIDGAANTTICEYFAKLFGVPKSAVAVAKGTASKSKTLAVTGGHGPEIRKILNSYAP